MNKSDLIRTKFKKGELVVGTHSMLGIPAVAELFGEVHFDALWIDMEHTAIDKQECFMSIIATSGTKIAPFVRVPWNDPVLIKPILEMGPAGIIIPMIKTAEEARFAISACTYPPAGIRGYGPIRAGHYGMEDPQEYVKEASRSLIKIIQIEHVEAVQALDEILSVNGVDAVVLGPNDLSASVGLLPQTAHTTVRVLLEEAVRKCKAAGIPVGVSTAYNCADEAESCMQYWLGKLHVDFIFLNTDVTYLLNGARNTLNDVRAWKEREGS